MKLLSLGSTVARYVYWGLGDFIPVVQLDYGLLVRVMCWLVTALGWVAMVVRREVEDSRVVLAIDLGFWDYGEYSGDGIL